MNNIIFFKNIFFKLITNILSKITFNIDIYMNILILFTKSTNLNYNKFLIIEAFKRNNNLINVSFYEIK